MQGRVEACLEAVGETAIQVPVLEVDQVMVEVVAEAKALEGENNHLVANLELELRLARDRLRGVETQLSRTKEQCSELCQEALRLEGEVRALERLVDWEKAKGR